MTARTAWIDAASRILDDLRCILAPFGVALAADLAVVADPHPCPGYLHDERVIAFCPPVIDGATDRARWLFFCRMMGCTSVEEAADFYGVALPLIICHEASHHLRMTRGVASPSHFIEEQVCDRMAVAMVEAIAAHRETLGPLRIACKHMIARLDDSFAASPGAAFVPDVGALLVATEQLDRAELQRLEQLAARRNIPLDELLALTGDGWMRGAAAARDLARQHVDTRYTENPAEYWHLGLTWVQSYLSRTNRPSIADVLQEHLLAHDDVRRASEVEGVLRGMLAVPAQRAGAAEGLLALRGAAVVRDIAEHAREADDILETLVRVWPRGVWDAEDASVLLAPESSVWSADRAPLLVRLAGKAGRPYSLPADHPVSNALALELAAADRTALPAVVGAMLIEPDQIVTLLEAWEANGRGLDELPHAALTTVVLQPPSPRARRAILRLAVTADPTSAAFELIAPLAIEELADPLGPAGEEAAANLVAHAVLDRLGDRATPLVWRTLPARGGPPWDQFLALLGRDRSTTSTIASDAPIEVRLREAAARADLREAPSANDPTVVMLAHQLLERGEQLLNYGAAIRADEFAATADALAAEVLVMAARGATLEVVRALAPAHTRTAIANIAADAARRAAVDDIVCDVLTTAVSADLRHRVARSLVGLRSTPRRRRCPSLDPDSLPVLDRAGDPDFLATLPPLAVAALSPTKDAMLTIEKLVHLRTVPLFAGVALEQLHEIATIAVVQAYAKDATIFREGDIGDRLFLVLAGHVAIEKQSDDHSVTLDELGPSSCFGEMALFDGTPRSATARALTECRLLTLSSTAIARIGRADPQIYEGFLRVLSKRLRVANVEVARRVPDRTSLV